MSINVKQLKRTEVSHLSLFCVIFFLSVLGMLLSGKAFIMQSTMFSVKELRFLSQQSIESNQLLLYVLRERYWVIPCMLLASTTDWGKAVGYLLCGWYGMGFGMLMGVMLHRYGLGGVFLLIGSLFPQYLFYVPAFVIGIRLMKSKRKMERRYLLRFLTLEVIILLGSIAESYVNPIVLQKIIGLYGVK